MKEYPFNFSYLYINELGKNIFVNTKYCVLFTKFVLSRIRKEKKEKIKTTTQIIQRKRGRKMKINSSKVTKTLWYIVLCSLYRLGR